jgi:hypothetical protein
MDIQQGQLTTIISTVRHGEKNDFGELTEQGARQAMEKGLGIENLQGDVILLHSGVSRVKESLTWMAKSLQKTSGKGSFTDYSSHYLHYLFDTKNKGRYFVKWEEVNGNPEAELLRMKSFLELENNSTEPDIYPSPRDMAIRLGRVIVTEIDFATITIPEVRTNYINGSHEPVIMSFLYYFLQNYHPQHSEFFKQHNVSLGFSEGFEIKVYQNLMGKNKVVLKFRDITKEIDQNKLKDFCRS